MAPDLLVGTYLVKGTAFILAVALVFGLRPKPAPVWLVCAGALLLFAGLLWQLARLEALGLDYRFFWEVGRDVWAGQDPYDVEHFRAHPFLNLPTALPLFALFALGPLDVSFFVWTLVNVVGCLLLLPLSRAVLAAQDTTAKHEQASAQAPTDAAATWRSGLTPLVIVGLTPALLVSDASLVSFYLGQLGILAAVALLAALYFQARGWAVLAGVSLALASVKVATMLPFLLLFLRKADRLTWVAMAATVLALCLATGSLLDLPQRGLTILERIGELEAPGMVNDYSFQGTRSENMLGIDHALYRLGLRDRRAIRIGQYLALASLGGWVAFEVLRKERLPRAAACSLVALFSVVFLYHRTYDAVILALPFVWVTAQARTVRGLRRWLFAGCALAILLVWYLDIGLLRALQQESQRWGVAGRLVQAVVLPYATWLVVLAMIALAIATRRSAQRCTEAIQLRG
jgi:hypothetical protein